MMPFTQIAKLLVSLGIPLNKILYVYAKSQIGLKKSGIKTSIEYGCAEAVNRIFLECFGEEIDGGISTKSLYKFFLDSKRFIQTYDVEVGDIIISPTGYGNGKISNGHVGIISDNGKIMSNNSSNGQWDEHLDSAGWQLRYAMSGGYPVFYFRVII